jgi:hypothetical protein
MQENKNLVEEALIQMKNVEEAIAENAKGILASTMKEEINQLVKESLSEQEEVDVDADVDMSDAGEDMDMTIDAEDDMAGDMDMELDMDADETPIDLTGASDEEILKVFKAMSEEDGIIVTKDDEEIQLKDNDSDNEYIIKLGESTKESKIQEQNELDQIVADLFNDSVEEDAEEDEEIMYEITLDEDSEEEDEAEEMDEEWGGKKGDESKSHKDYMDEAEEDEAEEMDEAEEDEAHNMDEAEEDEAHNMDEAEEDEAEEMDEAEEEDESTLDEQNWEESLEEAYDHKKAIKPKGVGIGKGPKFSYNNTAKGGFKEDKKEGPKMMGTGKPKFEYKKGANMEGKSKKVETKEGQGYDDREDEKLGMKHGKTAMKDLKGSHSKKEKSRRDDAGFEKRETKEAARTYGMGSKEGRGLRKGITNNRNYVYSNSGVKVESLESEVSMLRDKNEEYRKALNLFREKLNEVAIFNSNLAYATRLFTEHSTTKKEKINILRRFDSVETLKESKALYKSIKDELSTGETKSITESVEKLNTTVSSGSAINLIESKTYENPQFMRMKDLMTKIK